MRLRAFSQTANFVVFALASAASLACEPVLQLAPSEPLTLVQAQQKLALLLLENQENFPLSPDLNNVSVAELEQEKIARGICHLRTQSADAPELIQSADLLEQMAERLATASSDSQRTEAIDQLNQSLDRDSSTGYVLFPSTITTSDAAPTTFSVDLFATYLGNNCSETAVSSCTDAVDDALIVWWVNGLFRGLASQYNQQDVASSLEFTDKLARQWNSYKDDTIPLWPQEVLLSSITYDNKSEGFSPPPSYKMLALRPSLGISYLSDDKNHLKPTLNVDLLGIYWWEYGGSQGVEAQPGRGISASLIWDGDNTAYGLSYHHNPKYSFTIATSDENDVVLSVSLQLAYFFIR